MRGATSMKLWVVLALMLVLASPATAFGAGNIASISKIEGQNWRHGDIEDVLKTIAFLRGHKWTTMMVKRVYFGNWLRDYSQAMDVGSLKGVQAETIRILVWILSFLSFGYATGEFEVTSDRLGVYRPEEHIDNPKDYADNQDARKYDPRLRGPVQPVELEIDPATGMKNYIANEKLGIATSLGYVKFSLSRSIHFGRVYTSGSSGRGNDADLYEALRCLGQALHCLEDFGAHTNYTELALRELGFNSVFTHTGHATEMSLQGRRVFPLVTGTFGVVDFIHSVLSEGEDHFAQTEVEQMDKAMQEAESSASGAGTRGMSGQDPLSSVTSLLSSLPGSSGLVRHAQDLQAQSAAQQRENENAGGQPPSSQQGTAGASNLIPGTNIDPVETAKKIYPILEFRDKVVKAIAATIEKIPGLEKLVEKITDTVTLFVLSLLAPYIRPIINAVSKQLQNGSSGLVDASGRHQYEPWEDSLCTDPTHSMLSKDHFSNILNEPAGRVAASIVQYVAPRVLYAWQHPDVPVEQVLDDVSRVFHHPAIRDQRCELHMNMYRTVEQWARGRPDGGSGLDYLLSSESVRTGKNHTVPDTSHSFGQGGLMGQPSLPSIPTPHVSGANAMGKVFGFGSHSKVSGSPWDAIGRFRGDASGGDFVSRDAGVDLESEIRQAFPGTETGFDQQAIGNLSQGSSSADASTSNAASAQDSAASSGYGYTAGAGLTTPQPQYYYGSQSYQDRPYTGPEPPFPGGGGLAGFTGGPPPFAQQQPPFDGFGYAGGPPPGAPGYAPYEPQYQGPPPGPYQAYPSYGGYAQGPPPPPPPQGQGYGYYPGYGGY